QPRVGTSTTAADENTSNANTSVPANKKSYFLFRQVAVTVEFEYANNNEARKMMRQLSDALDSLDLLLIEHRWSDPRTGFDLFQDKAVCLLKEQYLDRRRRNKYRGRTDHRGGFGHLTHNYGASGVMS
ncbi:unnamed protein product, partial [Amoebophrya sp. A120]